MDVECHAPSDLYPETARVHIVQEAGWAPGLVWTGVEISCSHQDLNPEHHPGLTNHYTDYAILAFSLPSKVI